MSDLQFRVSDYVFRPTWLGTLITLVCIPAFISLGQWQYGKAQEKQVLQDLQNRHSRETPVQLPQIVEDPEVWKYRRVAVSGEYETGYQILLDNQVEGTRAGYHVITPLRINGTDRYVLVNRGWIPAEANHSDLPAVETPQGTQDVTGQVWVPSAKYYSLETPEQRSNAGWQPLWQNMDMQRYADAFPFEVSPLVVRLDADNDAGGFSRNWPAPAERITTHIGYAYQWYGFAVAAFIIYLVVSFRKCDRNGTKQNADAK
jgi:surfeit locus 1 family protein